MIDLTDLAIALLGILGTIVTAFLIPYLKQKVSTGTLEEVGKVISVAVWAAEMLYQGSDRGKEKKKYVYDCINKFLAEHNLKIELSVIENMIESAVLEMKNSLIPNQK